MNLELTNFANLAGHQIPRVFLLASSRDGMVGTSIPPFYRATGDPSPGLCTHTDSTLEPSPEVPPPRPNQILFLQNLIPLEISWLLYDSLRQLLTLDVKKVLNIFGFHNS